MNIEKVKQILNKFPKKDLAFIFDIYFVSYNCKDETENYLVNGRTLPVIYKVLIYPRAHERLKIILAHEMGHIVFEKKFNNEKRAFFIHDLVKTFPQIVLNIYKPGFVSEQFAECYDNYINNQDRLKEFPLLYNFFVKLVM